MERTIREKDEALERNKQNFKAAMEKNNGGCLTSLAEEDEVHLALVEEGMCFVCVLQLNNLCTLCSVYHKHLLSLFLIFVHYRYCQ